MPIRLPAVRACSQGMPISQQTGAMIQPSTRCSEIGAPATSGSRPRIALARCTSATSTISMAQMVSSSSRPGDGALDDGVHGARRDRLGLDQIAAVPASVASSRVAGGLPAP